MNFDMMLFAYLGPETVLPMTSAVAGVAGVVMLFGRSSFRWASALVKSLFSRVRRRSKPLGVSRRIDQGQSGAIGSPSKPRSRVRS